MLDTGFGPMHIAVVSNTVYRVYYAIAGNEIVLLLCGGDKRTQDSDITRACEYWQDWQRRTDDEA